MLTVQAPAKVNLVLEVLGKRHEYHDISSIAQTIALHDTLTFKSSPDIVFTCSEASLQDDNLVIRAARLLRERCAVARGAHIHLDKRIPWAAGLGGGSSDAAATLCALNRMWETGLSLQQLTALGSELGSDVPLFLLGGTILLEGRGERVSRLPLINTRHLVLLVPTLAPPAGKTGLMYRSLHPEMFTRGQFVRAAAFSLDRNGSIPEDLIFNVFEKVAFTVFPGLADERTVLEDITGRRAHLAGSGPCLYVFLPSEKAAQRTATRLEASGRHAYAVRTCDAVSC